MKRRHKSTEHPVHFISGYVRRRIPLFKIRPDFAQLFLDTLGFYRREKGIRVFAYVVMPDHYHLLLGFPQELRVSDFLRDFKSYVGKQVVERLRAEGALRLLERFRSPSSPRRRRDPSYRVLQPDNDDRPVHSERFFRQKLEYIHNNPWKKGLVERTVDYPWSSCRCYLTGELVPIPIDSWEEPGPAAGAAGLNKHGETFAEERKPRLLLASASRGKLRELAALAAAEGFQLEPLPGFDGLPKFPENEPSFALNALEKALHYGRHADGLVVADDSGIVVDALGGGPGVHSARYSGPKATDEDNNRKLLDELRGVVDEKRTARYICVLALARQGRLLALFSAVCEGGLQQRPRGTGGFGYDPLFFFPPLDKTMAELDIAEKNQHSHRGKAFRKLLSYLKQHPAVL